MLCPGEIALLVQAQVNLIAQPRRQHLAREPQGLAVGVVKPKAKKPSDGAAIEPLIFRLIVGDLNLRSLNSQGVAAG
jgi:hypothetical protein